MKSVIGLWLAATIYSQGAGIEFPEMSKEINAPSDAKILTVDFPFTNMGKKASAISKSDPGCSCLKVEVSGGKLKYEPGESGVLRATFDMGNFSGSADKVVALWIDDDEPNSPSKKLNVRVNIPVLVEIEPKTVRWDLGTESKPQTLHITMKADQPIKVLSAKCSAPAFTCELKTLEEGRKYEIIVTPLVMDSPGIGVIRIETDCSVAKHRIQQAFAVVSKPSAAGPKTP